MNRFLLFALSFILGLGFASSPLRAQDEADAKAKVIEAIKAADTKEELEMGLKKAKKIGANDQQILEGKLLWAVIKSEDVEYFETLSKEIEAALPTWKLSDAMMIKKPKQIEAMKHYMAALKADAGGDAESAKKEILMAIWLDPTTDTYVKRVKKLQPSDDKIPMDLKVETSDGKKVTLADYAKGNKAVYIQVWATWCGPCVRLFPALSARAKTLPPQGIAVVALNSELGREGIVGGNISKAKELKQQKRMSIPWLIEPTGGPYTELLEIDSVPRAIVVDPKGNVLFNEHPMDNGLVTAMKKLGAKLDINAGMEQ